MLEDKQISYLVLILLLIFEAKTIGVSSFALSSNYFYRVLPTFAFR